MSSSACRRRFRPAGPVDVRDDLEQLLAALPLVVEAGVLDRDARRDRERTDELLVDLGELVRALLLGQVEVAEHLVAHADRDAQERGHRRVVGREAEGVGVRGEVREPQRPGIADEQAEDAVALGLVPDPRALLVVDADGDELHEAVAILADDAERAVPGVVRRHAPSTIARRTDGRSSPVPTVSTVSSRTRRRSAAAEITTARSWSSPSRSSSRR